MTPSAPDALLLITPRCPHCAAVLEGLGQLVKEGAIGRLEIINLAVHPDAAAAVGARAAPWYRIGLLEFEGAMTVAALREWAERTATTHGRSLYLAEQLGHGQLAKVQALVQRHPDFLAATIPLLEAPETNMSVRLGVAALLEGVGAAMLTQLLPDLARLSQHDDPRIRGDACHYLGLTGAPQARPFLLERTHDENAEVREIAVESLGTLEKE